jgi:hypothetical protein
VPFFSIGSAAKTVPLTAIAAALINPHFVNVIDLSLSAAFNHLVNTAALNYHDDWPHNRQLDEIQYVVTRIVPMHLKTVDEVCSHNERDICDALR